MEQELCKVKVAARGKPDAPKDSWLAYHSSCDPLELLLLARPVEFGTRTANHRVCWVNRYDWGYHCACADQLETGAAQFFADIDPDSGWAAAVKRQDRLEARVDTHLKDDKSSSFFKSEQDADAFGCILNFVGSGDWECARLIFGEEESMMFPGKKELIGFWYDDNDNRYNDSEIDMGWKLEDPIIEHV
ncbi:hypothetical protein C8R47DRAFT_1248470 [Mycena vitilis]|nr:hypothetical protein C8R47DRAFT_1248470 [Mycena vitilis]